MTPIGKAALVAGIAIALASINATDADAVTKKPGARTKFTVYPKQSVHAKRRWRGHGFLPGYRQPPDLTDWRTPRTSAEPEIRYWSPYDGELRYGWGRPGFHRGRWTGGSFGPCWTYTPIGKMWNCGQ
jgi:hypothetical protein